MSRKHDAPEDRPLFVHEITGEGQSSGAIRADIAELLRDMQSGKQPDREVIATIQESQAHLIIVSLGVLARLDELGAGEALEASVQLGAMDLVDDEPLKGDLSTLSSIYDGMWRDEQHLAQRQELKDMAVFCHAASALAVVQAQRFLEGQDTSASAKLLPAVREAVLSAQPDVPPPSYEALTAVYGELEASIRGAGA